MELWIARDKDGTLWLFSEKPVLDKDYWWYNDSDCEGGLGELDSYCFPEVTFENSPQKVEFKLIEE